LLEEHKLKNANRAKVIQELADLFHRDLPPDDPKVMIGLAYEKLRRVIAYPQAGVFPINPTTLDFAPIWDYGTPKQISEEYFRHYFQFDPWVIELASLKNPNSAIRYSDFTDLRQTYKTEMADFFHSANYHHTIACVPIVKGLPFAVIGLRRGPNDPDFDNEETWMFEWFANHLALGLERASLIHKLYGKHQTRLLLCLPDGRVAMASEAMASWLDLLPNDGILRVPGLHQPVQMVRLVEHTWRVESHPLQHSSLLSSSGALGLGHTPLLERLARKVRMPSPLPGLPFCVTVEPSSASGALFSVRGDLTHWLMACHFTARELEISTLLLRGLSLKEIASHCDIAMATLKDHLHHIYEKAGVKNRAQFAAKMFDLIQHATDGDESH
jgi:DNA-binding CsgD family transcriptional regulator